MPRSNQPSLRELRSIYLLAGACGELRADPRAWQRRVVEELPRILGGELAVCVEAVPAAPPGTPGWLRLAMVDSGWPTDRDRALYLESMRVCSLEDNPLLSALLRNPGRLRTRTRRQLAPDRAWYRSVLYNDFVRPTGLDHLVNSFVLAPGGMRDLFVSRPRGQPEFSPRQRRLQELLVGELAAELTCSLTTAAPGASQDDLTPRLLQVLGLLADGDSEKAIASRLDLSPHTVHEHVKRLHRHFGVSSRGELLARNRGGM